MFVKWRRAPVSQHQQQVNSPAGAHLLLVIIIILKVRAGHSTKKEATAHSWTHISKMALEERLGACSNCICCYICLCANVLQTRNNRCIATALLQYSVARAAVLEHESLYVHICIACALTLTLRRCGRGKNNNTAYTYLAMYVQG